MGPFFVFLFLLLFAMMLALVKSKLQLMVRQRPRLPPGSMGWPFLGETLQLFSQTPNQFFTTRQSRYGDIFKTHILGYPCIMMANPDAARFVLVTNPNLFKPTYPKSKQDLIGSSAIFFQQAGIYHTHVRKLVQASLSLETVKAFISPIEAIVTSMLDSWSVGHVVHTFYHLKKLAFEVAILSIFGDLDSWYKKELEDKYYILDKGYNSFPTLVPGTLYYRSFKARKALSRLISEIIEQRKERRMDERNLLGFMLRSELLSHKEVIDNIIGVLFAAQDTTATLLTWILKFITTHPNILQSIRTEQETIYKANDDGERTLTWPQIKSMVYTNRVIQESQRMASIISFTYREATQDVEYNDGKWWTKAMV